MNEKIQLRFFFDYGAGNCLWCGNQKAYDTFGGPDVDHQLPLSPQTIKQIEDLDAQFYDSLNKDYPIDPGPWRQDECEKFNAAVHQLYEQIKKELGSEYEIINDFKDLQEDPDLDRYLQDPKNFKRN